MPILIEGLPNDITIMCLARVPFYLHPKLEVVSRSWQEAIHSSELFKAREATNSLEELLCVCLKDPGNLWELYDPLRDLWITLPLLPSKAKPLVYFGVVSTFGKIFVIGGLSNVLVQGRFVTDQVCCYDLIIRNWAARMPMLVPRTQFACCILGGKIVVAGGRDEDARTISKAEIYDPEKDVWVSLPDLNHIRDAHIRDTDRVGICAGVVIEERVHVFHTELQRVQIWDNDKLEWDISKYSDIVVPTNRSNTMTVVGGSVFIMKYGSLYKQERDETKLIADASKFNMRNGFAMVGLGDDIYTIGGHWILALEKMSDLHVLTVGSERPTWRQVASMTNCSGRILGHTNLRI